MRIAIVVVVMAAASLARAQDEFEIQVYDVEVARRGAPGAELHANFHDLIGAPDELHVTLEPHYGVLDWLEIGGYVQSSTATTGDVRFAGAKLRCKMRRPGRLWRDRIGLAINVEVSAVPARFEPNVYGSELRPIVDLSIDRFFAAVNPIVAIDLGGALAGRPQLEPAAKLGVHATRAVMIGGELYAALGPIDALGSEHAMRAYAVVDVAGAWWDLGIGVGWTWFSADRAVAKVIFAIHPRSPPPPPKP
jgi:hypothetical protein